MDNNLNYYNTAQKIEIGDYVIADGMNGLVVCDFDDKKALTTYPQNPNQVVDPMGLNPAIIYGAGALAGVLGIAGMQQAAQNNTSSDDSTENYPSSESSSTKTADELSLAHELAASYKDKTAAGYGGNCTPEEHDELKRKQDEACNQSKGVTCKNHEINYAKADLLNSCANARIEIARKCFAGGNKGHNQQIDQQKREYSKCLGRFD